jgi:hypothetical protein
MLTFADRPTIRHAITKRLDKEREVSVLRIPIKRGKDCIRVGVLAQIGDHLLLRSVFELPLEFEHAHLLNEIDEIAECCKSARVDYLRNTPTNDGPIRETATREGVCNELAGTGLRGRWKRHAS